MRKDFNDDVTQRFLVEFGFEKGVKWALHEFLKDLFHHASEVPRNDNGNVLAFSKECGYRKLYDMNDELDEYIPKNKGN